MSVPRKQQSESSTIYIVPSRTVTLPHLPHTRQIRKTSSRSSAFVPRKWPPQRALSPSEPTKSRSLPNRYQFLSSSCALPAAAGGKETPTSAGGGGGGVVATAEAASTGGETGAGAVAAEGAVKAGGEWAVKMEEMVEAQRLLRLELAEANRKMEKARRGRKASEKVR